MQVYRFQKKPVDIPRTVVTIGNFDGIHLGHRELISAAVNEAHLRGCVSALVTFDPHPQEIIHSQQSVSHICTSVHQLRLLEEQGLDEVHVIQFTSEMSQMHPEDFALQFLIKRFDLVKLVIGYDFRFGKHRAGDFKLLENLSQQFNFSLEEIAPVQQKGQTVSSSLIRQLIREFRFAEIPQYLGREYSIYGKVEKGEQRGKKLGFSTANIFPEVTLALAAGVYVTKIKLANKIYFGVTNAGNKPTFGNNTFTVETFIFDFEDDIYGEYLEVIPLHQLRPETKFLGMEDLKKQIMKDVKSAQEYLSSNNLSS
ncbi:MAG: bifunctional riboflavin kinase/FAD synthetase, partial [SAR324 cluster bacterium]|nr:bifunctional riboflavin kinase/FAD synthetase [SAR324 cluster bacterium]